MIYEMKQDKICTSGDIEFVVTDKEDGEQIMRIWVNPVLPAEPSGDGFQGKPVRLASPIELRDLAKEKVLHALLKQPAHLERVYKKVPVGTIEI